MEGNNEKEEGENEEGWAGGGGSGQRERVSNEKFESEKGQDRQIFVVGGVDCGG